MNPYKTPIKKACTCLVWCAIILGFTWAILSGINKVTERKTKYYDNLKREHYVDIASDQTERPRKYLGQTS